MSIAILFHIVAAVIWVGGMFFAYMALRPVAASQLEPPQRLALWVGVFGKFFPWVWVSILTLLVSGYTMALQMYGGVTQFPLYINLMQGIGIVMILIFGHIFFAGYKPMAQLVKAEAFADAAQKLNRIRQLVGLNLILGLAVVAIASSGRFGFSV
ncbi:MAG TPA: hypothetical protein EYN73_03545 [Chromatiaceae bacterium]|jgi:uncharacterized membrane protein|nr:hypothetical protein [Chromatiaceae bacterium]HIN82253.1 hypothetical protein [Chromatiales bacterium]HIA08147.1 hypothetical protein [Chromatiaceae bacterium]HIB83157.1 hypothetical protein [Chromatiaceae bacterium]HIO13585.1 hypothetical protein [Chromatiales bacterium]